MKDDYDIVSLNVGSFIICMDGRAFCSSHFDYYEMICNVQYCPLQFNTTSSACYNQAVLVI